MLLRSVDVGVVALLDDLRDGSESAVPSRFSFGMLTLDPDMVRPLVAELLPLDGLGVIPEALEPLGLRWRATAPASAASPLC